MLFHVLFLLSSLLTFTQALEITGSIVASTHLPSPALLPPSTLLVLSAPGIEYKTHPSTTGGFTFHNVTAGQSYLLQVQCLTHIFPPLRIDTANEEIEVHQTFRGNKWNHRGSKLSYPIHLLPASKIDYYVPRSSFRIDAIFKNPMVLLGIVSLVLVFGIPRLTASLDPEALAEYRAQQAQTPAPQLPSFDLASFMAGSSKPATEQKRK